MSKNFRYFIVKSDWNPKSVSNPPREHFIQSLPISLTVIALDTARLPPRRFVPVSFSLSLKERFSYSTSHHPLRAQHLHQSTPSSILLSNYCRPITFPPGNALVIRRVPSRREREEREEKERKERWEHIYGMKSKRPVRRAADETRKNTYKKKSEGPEARWGFECIRREGYIVEGRVRDSASQFVAWNLSQVIDMSYTGNLYSIEKHGTWTKDIVDFLYSFKSRFLRVNANWNSRQIGHFL